jgi:hypothetical protein
MRKTKVDVKKLLKIPCCFEESMTPEYLIDALKLCVYLHPLALRRMAERGALTKRPRPVKETWDLGLEPREKVTVKHFEGGRFLSWQSPLGRHMQNVKSSPSMVVHMNLIRAARAALPAAVRARHRANPDNYIDPRLVPISEARRLGFAFFSSAIEQLVPSIAPSCRACLGTRYSRNRSSSR